MNSSVASVNTAIAAISNGTLTGLVPAAGLINTLAAAQAAEAAGQTANTAAVDALVAKIAASNKAAGVDAATTKTDDIIAGSLYSTKVTAITDDAALARLAITNSAGGDKDTTVLVARAATADTAVKTTYAALSTAEKAQGDKYVAAVAAEAAAKTGAATVVAKGSAIGGLDADATAAAALLAYTGSAKTAAGVYADYVVADAAGRNAIDVAFKASAFYSTFKATVAKDAAYADAIKATSVAKNALDTDITDETLVTIGTVNTVAIKGTTDAIAGSVKAQAYVDAVVAKAAADVLVTKAQVADADVVAAKAITDANKALNDATVKATDAINTFNGANTTVKAVAIASVDASSTVKESFYFADKVGLTAGTDYTIGSATATAQFGAGDSIVLGSGYTFNSGALSTGNNNALEFFFVKTDTGTQVVVEGTVFGSGGVTASATTGVASVADGLTVINLVGVTADHLSVANGVVSYV